MGVVAPKRRRPTCFEDRQLFTVVLFPQHGAASAPPRTCADRQPGTSPAPATIWFSKRRPEPRGLVTVACANCVSNGEGFAGDVQRHPEPL